MRTLAAKTEWAKRPVVRTPLAGDRGNPLWQVHMQLLQRLAGNRAVTELLGRRAADDERPVVARIGAPADAATAPPSTELTAEEETALAKAVSSGRHRNKYITEGEKRVLVYRGWSYLTNIVWYMRKVRTKAAGAADPVLATFASSQTITIPGVPNLGYPGNSEWDAIKWGAVIPFVQTRLSEIRAPAFKEDPGRRYRDEGDADEAMASRRLKMLSVGQKMLGWEYAQKNPERTEGKEYGRRRTIDCSNFTAAATEGAGAGLSLGGTVSAQYTVSVFHPEKLRVIKGPRCTQVEGKTVTRGSETVPVIEPVVENVELAGEVLAGDLGIRGIDQSPRRGKDGGLVCDFRHVLMFTGRTVGGQQEYIHAPDVGEGVDLDVTPLSKVPIILRPS